MNTALLAFVSCLDRARADLASNRDGVPERELLALMGAATGVIDTLPGALELTDGERSEFVRAMREFLPVLQLGIKGEWPTLKPVVLGLVAVAIDQIVAAVGNAEMAKLNSEHEEF